MSKSEKKVKCPFCSFRNTKEKVIHHIEVKHEEDIPEGYTATRVLFNHIHHKDHGICVVCKRPTAWNEERGKYNRLCGDPECRKKLREMYQKNMMHVFGTDNILNDPEQQKRMLANRHISGMYRFRNGKIKEYTGSYEKNMLVFLDQIMGFDPDDILMPGPTIDYEYKGEHHQWITDALIIPYNLIIEVKDGGDNPNNRVMTSYREKQIAKEKMITNMGTYNYVRLTNNQFDQLIAILYELKMQLIDDTEENKKPLIRVHESSDLEPLITKFEEKAIQESKRNNPAFFDVVTNTVKNLNPNNMINNFIHNNNIQGFKPRDLNLPGLPSRMPGKMDKDYDCTTYNTDNKPNTVYLIYPYHNSTYHLPLLAVTHSLPMSNSIQQAFYSAIYLCSHGKSKVLNTKETLYIDRAWWNDNKTEMFYFIESHNFDWNDGKATVDVLSNGSNYKSNIMRLEKILFEKIIRKYKKINVKFGRWRD